MMRVWTQENPGQRGLSVIPARDTTEKAWFDVLGAGELTPMGYKPIGAATIRRLASRGPTASTAAWTTLQAAIDRQLAEIAR